MTGTGFGSTWKKSRLRCRSSAAGRRYRLLATVRVGPTNQHPGNGVMALAARRERVPFGNRPLLTTAVVGAVDTADLIRLSSSSGRHGNCFHRGNSRRDAPPCLAGLTYRVEVEYSGSYRVYSPAGLPLVHRAASAVRVSIVAADCGSLFSWSLLA